MLYPTGNRADRWRHPRADFILNPDAPQLITGHALHRVAAAQAQLNAQGSPESTAIVLIEEQDRLGMSLCRPCAAGCCSTTVFTQA